MHKQNTNPRYINFTQQHFTAGDFEQFHTNRNKSPYFKTTAEYVPENNVFFGSEFILHPLFNNQNSRNVSTTFDYLFNKFKKGIFIQILNNTVSVKLPFSKHAFVNEWSSLIKYDFPATIYDINEIEGRIVRKDNHLYNTNSSEWYANNALIRYEYPLSEGDSGVKQIFDMFTELCANRIVPNTEFFVNRRDFPVLTVDGTEPYNHLFGDNTPLVSHAYQSYSPIFGMCRTNRYADILIPTWEDWNIVTEDCVETVIPTFSEWMIKADTAVFRGSSTGVGTNVDTNMRIKISKMSMRGDRDSRDNVLFLDAGIVKWNARVRKHRDSPYLKTLEISDLKLVEFMSPSEQSRRFKYIVNIDGHVTAYRLSRELRSFSVILLVESDYKIWYSDRMIAYKHYVPISRDLSNLYTQILWCKNHPHECYSICLEAHKFYNTYICKAGIFDYLQFVLNSISLQSGSYRYNKSPLDIQTCLQRSLLFIPDIRIPIVTERILHKNTNSEVSVVSLDGELYAYKKCHTILHEAFIGLNCINTIIDYGIPNFVRTIGLINGESGLLLEYVESMTLKEYILSGEFVFQDYLQILIQVCLALYQVQLLSLFTHNDLYPWNILIQKLPVSREIIYRTSNVDYTAHLKINTKLLVNIIDYGKSQGVVNSRHGMLYHNQGCLRTSSIQDVMCLLISSMFFILHHRTLSGTDLKGIFTLSRFFSGGGFTKYTNFSRVKELKQFLLVAKRYSEMSESNKYELENLTPIDLVYFILTNFTLDDISEFRYPEAISEQVFCPTIIPFKALKFDLSIFDDEEASRLLYSQLYNVIPNHYNLQSLFDLIWSANTGRQRLQGYNGNFYKYLEFLVFKESFMYWYEKIRDHREN